MSQPRSSPAINENGHLELASPLHTTRPMMPVKTTAAVLAASMTLFSVAPAAAASGKLDSRHTLRPGIGGATNGQGSTPIAPSSTGSGTVGPTGSSDGSSSNGSSDGSTSGNGVGSAGSLGGGMIGSGISGAPAVPGTPGTTASPGTVASPISNGGNNTGRPGPRSPEEQPTGNNGSRGPFSEAPRTTDGTEGKGFNMSGFFSGLSQFTSTVMNLVWTFSMLKSVFGWFGNNRERSGDRVKEVVAANDRGTNVGREANTKIDEKLEDERRRASGEGRGEGVDPDTDEAAASGLTRD